ncbi:DUF1549 domain-containing protein [Prosthecobacter sp.]|uniref:DUF1549 domain-containing protein n=1 Tax=Prosthecobacter sp. TaxID=1965333 RepID=UPI002ABC1C34|nr:DUF1549 domain-containing protein [Prosthecobacter sp.]MDZ4401727.1 DUF1549 domain-containing protein [Prosthecobacter sp.]
MKRFTLLLLLFIGSAHAAEPDTRIAARQIDTLLAQDWQKHSLKGNAPASDEIFVRRIHLDLVGRIPTHQETVSFLSATDKDKRAKLIDQLLASEGFTMHQFHFYADLLRVLSKGTYNGDAGRVTGMAYAEFIKDSVRTNKPYDQLVRELVSAQGKVWENGAVGYYQRDRGMPLDNLSLTMRIFTGTRIECAQCHNHPFDKWTQMQFHQMAAYTYGVQTVMGIYSPSFFGMLALQKERREKNGTSMDDEIHLRQAFNEMIVPIKHAWVSRNPQQLRLPHDYQYDDAKPKSLVKAATLMGAPAEYDPKGNPLESFAAWMTSPEHPRFTVVIANRLWRKLFGIGLIEPADEIMDTTVAANPALMEHLRRLMIAQRYDVKAFLRVLCNTQAYQREVTRTELALGEVYHFTGPLLRRMTPEQMWDSFTTLIHTAPDLPNVPLREATDTFLANARKLGEALEHLTPAELLQRADITSEVFRKNAAQFKVLQQGIAEAQKREDKATVKALAGELGVLRKAAIQTADEQIYIPAVMKLSAQSKQTGESYKGIEVPGYQPPDRSAETAAQTQLFLADAARVGIPPAQHAIYLKHRQSMMRLWPRAAEIDSPAPAGHALREFGQSDREFVENANHDASVPQALVLMNGQMLPNILNSWSQVMLAVKQARYPDDKIEAVYLALLSRKPTAEEMAAWAKAQSHGLNTIQDLVYALLNSQQFIFIQ